MLSKFELFIEGSHQLVDVWLAIASDNILRHAIVINDVCLNKISGIFLLTFLRGISSAHLEK